MKGDSSLTSVTDEASDYFSTTFSTSSVVPGMRRRPYKALIPEKEKDAGTGCIRRLGVMSPRMSLIVL